MAPLKAGEYVMDELDVLGQDQGWPLAVVLLLYFILVPSKMG